MDSCNQAEHMPEKREAEEHPAKNMRPHDREEVMRETNMAILAAPGWLEVKPDNTDDKKNDNEQEDHDADYNSCNRSAT